MQSSCRSLQRAIGAECGMTHSFLGILLSNCATGRYPKANREEKPKGGGWGVDRESRGMGKACPRRQARCDEARTSPGPDVGGRLQLWRLAGRVKVSVGVSEMPDTPSSSSLLRPLNPEGSDAQAWRCRRDRYLPRKSPTADPDLATQRGVQVGRSGCSGAADVPRLDAHDPLQGM